MRARVLPLGLAFAGVTTLLACIPDPKGDFEEYEKNIAPYANGGSSGNPDPGDAGPAFDAAPPTQAVTGLYAGACLSQLAFGIVDRVFSFVAETEFTPDGGGGKLTLKLTALRLVDNKPPRTYTAAGRIGNTQGNAAPATPNVNAEGTYRVELGTVEVPGEANPITGRPVSIEQTALEGRFAQQQFCARLNGNVTQPVALTLEPERNVCHFLPVEEGGDIATAAYTAAQFAAATCQF